jgi:hypothetical protein
LATSGLICGKAIKRESENWLKFIERVLCVVSV